MPCGFCNNMFPNVPCNENETTKEFMLGLEKKYYLSSASKDTIISRYNKLKSNCPCVSCLVKMICSDKRFNCSVWKDFIEEFKQGDNK